MKLKKVKRVYCEYCGVQLKINSFPFGFFDNAIEFKEEGFIGNYYCYTCAERKIGKKRK